MRSPGIGAPRSRESRVASLEIRDSNDCLSFLLQDSSNKSRCIQKAFAAPRSGLKSSCPRVMLLLMMLLLMLLLLLLLLLQAGLHVQRAAQATMQSASTPLWCTGMHLLNWMTMQVSIFCFPPPKAHGFPIDTSSRRAAQGSADRSRSTL